MVKQIKPGGAATVQPQGTATPSAVPKKLQAAKNQKVPTKERKVVYPELKLELACGENALTESIVEQLLGWEDEERYSARVKGGKFGEDFLLKDVEGRKVRCWHNNRNRPFTLAHADSLGQDVLNRVWAGPMTIGMGSDGMIVTINCENIIISRYAEVISGQHRLIGFKRACMIWRKHNHIWRGKWPECPVLETSIAFGVSEDPRVIQTLDNVRPRTLADVFYTSEIFRDLNPSERKECSRMLQFATDMLWIRTGADRIGSRKVFQTHSESRSFLDNHPRLQTECIHHLFSENKDRALSTLRLSPGQMAAICYLMGACGTDGDDYRNMDPAPEERGVNWEHWERAKQFFVLLSADAEEVKPVRDALGMLVDAETGNGGRLSEKLSILSKAWNRFSALEPITEEDLVLETVQNEHDMNVFVGHSNFGGIDVGDEKTTKDGEAEVTAEEIEQAKIEIRKKKAEEVAAKLKEMRAKKEADAKAGQAPATRPLTAKEVQAKQTADAAKADANKVTQT